ncbi:MAG: bacillithiol system redox-active protein YtxJ [Taibaiella sp.]|nr:bacillithiol system redox-active protein YtxJ [Taibaiella sp.]
MNWIELTSEEQLAEIKETSNVKPVVVFKHSTRCSLSIMAKNRLDKMEPDGAADYFYLDLLRFRNLSNKIAEDFSVHHESPQVLLIKNGECIYEESHNGIMTDEIANEVRLAMA